MADYLGFFDLAREPFKSDGAQPLVLETGPMRRALEWTRTELAAGESLLCVRGATGIGKTCLAHALPHVLEHQVVLLPNPTLSWQQIQDTILEQLGIDGSVLSREVLLSSPESRRPVIVVDRAESISNEMFQQLSDLQRPDDEGRRPLVALVFLSRDQRLNPRLRELRGYRLTPMKPREIHRYLEARMLNVGFAGEQVFPISTCTAICGSTEGIPRGVDLLATTLLIEAMNCGAVTVTPELVYKCCDDDDAPALKQTKAPSHQQPPQAPAGDPAVSADADSPALKHPDAPAHQERSESPNAELAPVADADPSVPAESDFDRRNLPEPPSPIAPPLAQTGVEAIDSETDAANESDRHGGTLDRWPAFGGLSPNTVRFAAASMMIGMVALWLGTGDSFVPTTPTARTNEALSAPRDAEHHNPIAASSLNGSSESSLLATVETTEQAEILAEVAVIEVVKPPEANGALIEGPGATGRFNDSAEATNTATNDAIEPLASADAPIDVAHASESEQRIATPITETHGPKSIEPSVAYTLTDSSKSHAVRIRAENRDAPLEPLEQQPAKIAPASMRVVTVGPQALAWPQSSLAVSSRASEPQGQPARLEIFPPELAAASRGSH